MNQLARAFICALSLTLLAAPASAPVEFLRDESGAYSRFHYTWVENTWEGKRK